jgi:hypothetical protein
MSNVKHIETKGDVIFFEKDGKLCQQIGNDPAAYKVRNGRITYKRIEHHAGYMIKYNNNGVYGYAIFKGAKCLEDNIWSLKQARLCAEGMIYDHAKHWTSTNPGGNR